MIFCECPMCDAEISLMGYKESDVLKCPKCRTELEIISLRPPIVEEPLSDSSAWDEHDDDEVRSWEDKADDDWNDEDDDEGEENDKDDEVWNEIDDDGWNN